MPKLTGRQIRLSNTPEGLLQEGIGDSLYRPSYGRDGKRSHILRSDIPFIILVQQDLHELREMLLFWEVDLATRSAILAELRNLVAMWKST